MNCSSEKPHKGTNKTPEDHRPKPLITPLMNLPIAHEHPPPQKNKIKLFQTT